MDENEEKDLRREILHVISFFHQKGWAPATSTNYSFKTPGKDTYTISSSGVDKGHFQLEHFMEVNHNGEPTSDYQHLKPSAETLLHVLLYRDVTVHAVLHTHSVTSTVVSRRWARESGIWLKGYEVLKGLRGIVTHDTEVFIPIFSNSQDMAALSGQIQAYINQNSNVYGFLLEGHGLYSWGRNIAEAKRHVEVLEFLFECELASITSFN